ncbi:methylenetetrahydrofolate reductase isoform X1 [Cephus cinctus]|uniref:Methylenetetrahydrofolate reductase isoform X1 n=1 Tax=Cephus cinctus TaxID=211228 RepID=A0AAJ7FN66_CEPCN|nr:methylenetetrahydrofolate reductase isoform X1 [Cephus cinctus]
MAYGLDVCSATSEKFYFKLKTTGGTLFRKINQSSIHSKMEYSESQQNAINISSLIEEKIRKNEKFYSFELNPVKERQDQIYERFFSETKQCSPLFYTISWHPNIAGKEHASTDLIKILPNNTLLHLVGRSLNKENLINILKTALACGKINIFALRGGKCIFSLIIPVSYNPRSGLFIKILSPQTDSGLENGDFLYAIDLVKFIRSKFGSKFSICVAGYPQMHPNSPTKELDLFYLKEKVNAGANFIITQLFFDAKVFIDFVKDCRRFKILVPIIPGIYPIPNFKSLIRMTNMCKLEIPKKVLDILEPIQDNDEAVAKFGIDLVTNMIKEIFDSNVANGFHLFTFNRSLLASEVCSRVGLSVNSETKIS